MVQRVWAFQTSKCTKLAHFTVTRKSQKQFRKADCMKAIQQNWSAIRFTCTSSAKRRSPDLRSRLHWLYSSTPAHADLDQYRRPREMRTSPGRHLQIVLIFRLPPVFRYCLGGRADRCAASLHILLGPARLSVTSHWIHSADTSIIKVCEKKCRTAISARHTPRSK